MILQCISNKPEDVGLAGKYIGKGSGNNSSGYPLTIGREYAVYGIAKVNHAVLYLILDDELNTDYRTNSYEPVWYSKTLFNVLDERVDANWTTMKGTVWTNSGETASFPEFINEGIVFYEKLLEGNPEREKTLLNYINKYESARLEQTQ